MEWIGVIPFFSCRFSSPYLLIILPVKQINNIIGIKIKNMKQTIYCCIMAITFSGILSAQKFDSSKINTKLPLPKPNGKLAKIEGVIPELTVFEYPNYRGRSGNFRWAADGSLIPPFPVSSVSIAVATSKIMYIKNCSRDPATEAAYTTSQASINLSGICGIRSDDQSSISIVFNGFSTIIHNNDCKRFFGNIRIKVFETSPDGSGAMSYMPMFYSEYRVDAFTYLVYRNSNANTNPSGLRGRTYVFNASPVPELREEVTLGRFSAGANALREGRVSIMVTSDLGSAHKTCDLCDDFSSNVRMSTPITESIPLNKIYGGNKIVDAGHNKLVMGPYHAHGSRDGSAITASAGTDKDFRVHFTVLETGPPLPPPPALIKISGS